MSDGPYRTIAGLEVELLDRYVAGICTPDERQRVLQAVAAHPEWATLLERLDQNRVQADAAWNVDNAWGRVQRNVRRSAQPRFAVAQQSTARRQMLRWSYGVIGGLVAIGLVAVGFMTRGHWSGSQMAQYDYVTGRGERATVHLADGTEVTLGPATHLHVMLGARERVLRLEGEALFEVVHDPTHPLWVHTAHATVEDIGTTFGVRDYMRDTSASVVVRSGTVALQSNAPRGGGEVAHLGAGESGVVFATNGTPMVERVNPTTALAWTSGWLTYQNMNVADVATDLERWYDVDITIDPAIAQRRLVASFQAPTVDDALHIIAAALDVHVERHGRRVVISTSHSSLPSQSL